MALASIHAQTHTPFSGTWRVLRTRTAAHAFAIVIKLPQSQSHSHSPRDPCAHNQTTSGSKPVPQAHGKRTTLLPSAGPTQLRLAARFNTGQCLRGDCALNPFAAGSNGEGCNIGCNFVSFGSRPRRSWHGEALDMCSDRQIASDPAHDLLSCSNFAAESLAGCPEGAARASSSARANAQAGRRVWRAHSPAQVRAGVAATAARYVDAGLARARTHVDAARQSISIALRRKSRYLEDSKFLHGLGFVSRGWGRCGFEGGARGRRRVRNGWRRAHVVHASKGSVSHGSRSVSASWATLGILGAMLQVVLVFSRRSALALFTALHRHQDEKSVAPSISSMRERGFMVPAPLGAVSRTAKDRTRA